MRQAELDLLVLEAQNGNLQALECLVALFHPLLIKFAVAISGDHALAKDAAQDVWLQISKKLRSLDDPRAFKSWIYRAVRWRVIDLTRNKSTQFEMLDDNCATTDLDVSELEQRQLKGCINRLEADEREVIYLHYLAELSVAEVALVLKIPAGTVKSRLSRARNQLRELIDQ